MHFNIGAEYFALGDAGAARAERSKRCRRAARLAEPDGGSGGYLPGFRPVVTSHGRPAARAASATKAIALAERHYLERYLDFPTSTPSSSRPGRSMRLAPS